MQYLITFQRAISTFYVFCHVQRNDLKILNYPEQKKPELTGFGLWHRCINYQLGMGIDCSPCTTIMITIRIFGNRLYRLQSRLGGNCCWLYRIEMRSLCRGRNCRYRGHEFSLLLIKINRSLLLSIKAYRPNYRKL